MTVMTAVLVEAIGGLTLALAAFLLGTSALAILFPRRPLLGVTQHWGLQLWWLALLGAAVSAWLQIWPGLATCLGCALYWSWRLFARRPAPRPKARRLLRLVSANLAHFNRDFDRVLGALAACEADVIALMEVTPECRDRLRQLATSHPFTIDSCDLSRKYGVLVRARWPITELSRGGGGSQAHDPAPRHVAVRLELGGRAVDLIAVHLTNPIRRQLTHRIPGEIDALIRQIGQGGPDLILCGDCNAAGWSSWLRDLEAATGLANDRRLNPSWPLKLPPLLRLPIDQVWARGGAVVLETRLGPPTGSDHLPLVAEIGWHDSPDHEGGDRGQ